MYAGFSSLFCFGIRGRSYSNFLASTVAVLEALLGIPKQRLFMPPGFLLSPVRQHDVHTCTALGWYHAALSTRQPSRLTGGSDPNVL